MGIGLTGTRPGGKSSSKTYDHQGNHRQGTVPILAIDAWEHAYYLQYENDRARLFDALWSLIDWEYVVTPLGAWSLGRPDQP